MQCSSCRFENMPGADVCGRCGTSLRIGTMVMDVRPPRAGKFAKGLRRVVPVRQVYYGVRDGAEAIGVTASARRVRELADEGTAQTPPWPLLWRVIVPGWSQIYQGKTTRGRWYLGAFLAVLVPGLLLLGTTWGSILLGLAFSVHTSAAFDVFQQYRPETGMAGMMMRSVWVMLAVWMFIYLPAGWVVGMGALVRTIQADIPPLLRSGDAVLVNRSLHWGAYPRPGQIVLYTLPTIRIDRQEGSRHAIYEIGGERMERVLATGGDKVLWDGKRLIVNGKESALRPLDAGALPKRMTVTVPTDSVFILPSGFVLRGAPLDDYDWQRIAIVPRDEVLGTPYLRWQPFWRMKVIH